MFNVPLLPPFFPMVGCVRFCQEIINVYSVKAFPCSSSYLMTFLSESSGPEGSMETEWENKTKLQWHHWINLAVQNQPTNQPKQKKSLKSDRTHTKGLGAIHKKLCACQSETEVWMEVGISTHGSSSSTADWQVFRQAEDVQSFLWICPGRLRTWLPCWTPVLWGQRHLTFHYKAGEHALSQMWLDCGLHQSLFNTGSGEGWGVLWCPNIWRDTQVGTARFR